MNKHNIVDRAIINISDNISPLFRKFGYTPTGITTLSTIFGIASLYYLNNRLINGFLICYILYYYFNTMDERYAKTYNLESTFRIKYNFWKDLFIMISLFYVLCNKYKSLDTPILICILLFFLVMFMINATCQKYKNLKIVRLCEPGVITTLLLIFIYFVHSDYNDMIIK